MDKVTQAMLASKAASVKGDMKKNFSSIWGEDETPEEDRIQKEALSRQKSVQKMEEEREQAKLEREVKYKLQSEDRERERQKIRDKYKLKGSSKGVLPYGEQSSEKALASNAVELQKKKDCCVQ